MKKVGITLDIAESGSFSKRPHYALRVHYFDAVHAAGGLPIAIPHLPELIDAYLDDIDALIIPGGGFASPTHWYENPEGEMAYAPSARLQFDLAVIEKALERDIPLLGICAGMQLLAGHLGCKMTHNVHERFTTEIDHINGAPAEELCHRIDLTPGSLLASIYESEHMEVNSAHCEAVVSCPGGVHVTAVAPDGVIEAIEIPAKKLAMGVQWHPEFFLGDPLIRALLAATHSH